MRFRPNARCTVYPTLGSDIYGQELLDGGHEERCAVIKLTQSSQKTSVRTDSSASRGSAQEIHSDARILFTSASKIAVDDKVEVYGQSLRVVSVFPRYSLPGRLDHIQVDLNIWA